MTTDLLHRKKILVFASESCGYPGANATGQAHQQYSENAYIIRVPSPVLFPEEFYFQCFEKGAAAIILMSGGHECPYTGAYERLAKRIDKVTMNMKARGLDIRRLRLTSICTVCIKAFLNEIKMMEDTLEQIHREALTGKDNSKS